MTLAAMSHIRLAAYAAMLEHQVWVGISATNDTHPAGCPVCHPVVRLATAGADDLAAALAAQRVVLRA